MFGNIFSRSKNSQNISETSFQNRATDASLLRKKNVKCPTDEKYRGSIDFEFNTVEECDRAKRAVAQELAEIRDREQRISYLLSSDPSENAIFKAQRRKAAIGDDATYPNEKAGAIAQESAEMNKPYVRRDLAKEERDRRQMIRDSENAFFKAKRRRAAIGDFDAIYPNEKAGATVMIKGKPYILDDTLRPIVEGGRKSKKTKKSRKTKSKTRKSKHSTRARKYKK